MYDFFAGTLKKNKKILGFNQKGKIDYKPKSKISNNQDKKDKKYVSYFRGNHKPISLWKAVLKP